MCGKNKCNSCNECAQESCGCKVKLSSFTCIRHDGNELPCIDVQPGDNGETILEKINEAICNQALISKGEKGDPGEDGEDGEDGNTILSGSTIPTNSVGVLGDFYINTATSMLYGPKGSGGWPAGVSLLGPTGPQGPTGPTGPQGPEGPEGQGCDCVVEKAFNNQKNPFTLSELPNVGLVPDTTFTVPVGGEGTYRFYFITDVVFSPGVDNGVSLRLFKNGLEINSGGRKEVLYENQGSSSHKFVLSNIQSNISLVEGDVVEWRAGAVDGINAFFQFATNIVDKIA